MYEFNKSVWSGTSQNRSFNFWLKLYFDWFSKFHLFSSPYSAGPDYIPWTASWNISGLFPSDIFRLLPAALGQDTSIDTEVDGEEDKEDEEENSGDTDDDDLKRGQECPAEYMIELSIFKPKNNEKDSRTNFQIISADELLFFTLKNLNISCYQIYKYLLVQRGGGGWSCITF